MITVVILATMLMAAALAMDYYIKFLPGQWTAGRAYHRRQMAIVHRSGQAVVDALGHLRSHTISEWGRSVTDA